MNLLNLTYVVWMLSEIWLSRQARSGNTDRQNTDKHTQLYIWLSIVVSMTAGIFAAIKFSFPIFTNERFMVIGMAGIILGIIIRFVSIRHLGRFFTVDITIRKDHELMQRGFYKYVRHPSYTGSLLSFAGFGLSMNSWLCLFIVFVPVLITFLIRIHTEEELLTGQFGNQYVEYTRKTKRLIPFIY
ncbi:MAG: isoprenylcysteine carboxylmethyltransferase family protein [Bacteroidetes bacterium]|nr:isoprenylcysteine carboxylmethyltransferase family protein [Bacteroidota bacterium]